MHLLASFILQNLKKFFQRIQSYEDTQIFGPKMAHLFAQIWIFSEYLLMSLVPFIHAYLDAKNQSQIIIY